MKLTVTPAADRCTSTPTGRVLARLELVCHEILADEVPPGSPTDWVRRLIVKKAFGTPFPVTEHARRLAITLNICNREEARAGATALLLHCARIRQHHAAGLIPPRSSRVFRVRAVKK